MSFLGQWPNQAVVTINISASFYWIAYPARSFVPTVKRKCLARGIRKIPIFGQVFLAVQK